MQRFAWTEQLQTGVPMIDIQHKELVCAVNDLADAIEQGRGSAAIKQLIAFMKYYAEWHFGNEESCAEKYQCPLAEVNRCAHKQFIEMIEELQQQYRNSQADAAIATQIHGKLADWLVNHIMKIDKQIGQHICAHASG
ncbi:MULTISPECIES: hemerythrin family protein [unclassified Thermosynechococcus]|uniref:hemerythrin family protein n=1 Tax=unclassified Thermosynechococcus TaxID=2622553 RepID=UPI002673F9DD|nr:MULTISPECIES: hemerythrin family protein [unclassified Thermosynechococcus]WKT84356.1 hemerythrin family protein [Thermosynechococcus sp. HY596]WNC63490.1 hemerythrin family protein [Thermosynechococcus sp. HY591]WNC66050.1 hemerythrin family protein [Thermosynechococcus sp. HY593]